VSEGTDLDRWEITTAVIGLRGAYERSMDAYDRGLIPNWQIAAVAVAEFVFWACALDERLKNADPGYKTRRDRDEQGQVLLALRFTRDRHTHQMAITTTLEIAFERFSDVDGRADLMKIGNRWRRLDALPKATGGHQNRRDYPGQEAACKKHLEGRWPGLAMRDARDFLNREVAARGIEVPNPSQQV
jgi:hypothetical protein